MAAKTRTFEKGELIFSDGQWAELAYVIKSGRVEIFLDRNGQQVTLGTMGPGSCFGEMAPIMGGRRTASAKAMSNVLCIEIDALVLKKMVENCDGLMRAIVLSLIERVKKLNKTAGYEIRYDNAIMTCAHGLYLIAEAQKDPEAEDSTVHLVMHEAVLHLSKISGRPRGRITDLLKHMKEIHLINIVGSGPTADLIFDSNKIMEHANGLTQVMNEDKLKERMAALDTLALEEIAEMLHLDVNSVWQNLQNHPNLPDLLRFKFQDTVNWLEHEGKQ